MFFIGQRWHVSVSNLTLALFILCSCSSINQQQIINKHLGPNRFRIYLFMFCVVSKCISTFLHFRFNAIIRWSFLWVECFKQNSTAFTVSLFSLSRRPWNVPAAGRLRCFSALLCFLSLWHPLSLPPHHQTSWVSPGLLSVMLDSEEVFNNALNNSGCFIDLF